MGLPALSSSYIISYINNSYSIYDYISLYYLYVYIYIYEEAAEERQQLFLTVGLGVKGGVTTPPGLETNSPNWKC